MVKITAVADAGIKRIPTTYPSLDIVNTTPVPDIHLKHLAMHPTPDPGIPHSHLATVKPVPDPDISLNHLSMVSIAPFVPSKAYATRKTIAQGALDFALLMANASQLKALVDIPANNRGTFYAGLLVLLGISIALQIAAGLVLLVLGMTDPKDHAAHRRTENLNNASVCLILLITVVNVFISAFGISYVDDKGEP